MLDGHTLMYVDTPLGGRVKEITMWDLLEDFVDVIEDVVDLF